MRAADADERIGGAPTAWCVAVVGSAAHQALGLLPEATQLHRAWLRSDVLGGQGAAVPRPRSTRSCEMGELDSKHHGYQKQRPR